MPLSKNARTDRPDDFGGVSAKSEIGSLRTAEAEFICVLGSCGFGFAVKTFSFAKTDLRGISEFADLTDEYQFLKGLS